MFEKANGLARRVERVGGLPPAVLGSDKLAAVQRGRRLGRYKGKKRLLPSAFQVNVSRNSQAIRLCELGPRDVFHSIGAELAQRQPASPRETCYGNRKAICLHWQGLASEQAVNRLARPSGLADRAADLSPYAAPLALSRACQHHQHGALHGDVAGAVQGHAFTSILQALARRHQDHPGLSRP